jgi:hypothetical protein
MIKSFNEFINEGLFDKLNGKKQIADLQSLVIRACEKSIAEFPDKFSTGKDVLEYIKSFAEKKYKEIVTAKLAVDFSKWWGEFTKYYTEMFDEIIKKNEKGKYDLEKEFEEEEDNYDYQENLDDDFFEDIE